MQLFSAAALEQARTIRVDSDVMRGRDVAQGITLGRSKEQAFWVEKIGDTHRVSVSFPDIAALVARDTVLDKEAYARVFTTRDGDGLKPIFPSYLAADLFSLPADKPRPTLTVTVPFDAKLDPGEPEFSLTVVANSKEATGPEMAKALSDRHDPMYLFFQQYKELAEDLMLKRRANGALAFFDMDRGMATTPEGKLLRFPPGQESVANFVRQELLIAAGQAVAEHLLDYQYPMLFRNHKANPSAPSHEALVHDLTIAIAHPGAFDPTLYERRRISMFERGKYGPFLEGHYGLNVPAYVELESPGSRYPSLVTQRIIKAFMDDEEPPYSYTELDTIGQYFGHAVEAINASRRAQAKGANAVTVEPQPRAVGLLSQVSGEVFGRVIERATKDDELRADIREEIVTRLQDGKLPDRDIFALLTGPDVRSEDWQTIHTEIIRWLVENPDHIRNVAGIGVQQLGWEKISDRRVKRSGPPNERVSMAVATIVTDAGEKTSDPIYAMDPLRAKQYAELDALAKVLDIEIPEIEELSVDGEQELTPGIEAQIGVVLPENIVYTEREDPEHNYTVDLYRAVKDRGLGRARYQTIPHGRIHNPYYTSIATISVKGSRIVSEFVIGKTDKDAEQSASKNLLPKLPEKEKKKLARPLTVTNGDYKSPVLQLGKQLGWKEIRYKNDPEPQGGFVCTVEAQDSRGNKIVHKAKGDTSKEATSTASQELIAMHYDGEIIEK